MGIKALGESSFFVRGQAAKYCEPETVSLSNQSGKRQRPSSGHSPSPPSSPSRARLLFPSRLGACSNAQDPRRSETLASRTRGLLGNLLSFLLLVGLEISLGVQPPTVPAPSGVHSHTLKIQQRNFWSPLSCVFMPCSWAHLIKNKRQPGSTPTGCLAWNLQGLIERLSSSTPPSAPQCLVGFLHSVWSHEFGDNSFSKPLC